MPGGDTSLRSRLTSAAAKLLLAIMHMLLLLRAVIKANSQRSGGLCSHPCALPHVLDPAQPQPDEVCGLQMAVLGLATVLSGSCAPAAARAAAAAASHSESASGQIAAASDNRGADPARPQSRGSNRHRQARLRHQLVRAIASVTVTVTKQLQSTLCFAATHIVAAYDIHFWTLGIEHVREPAQDDGSWRSERVHIPAAW